MPCLEIHSLLHGPRACGGRQEAGKRSWRRPCALRSSQLHPELPGGVLILLVILPPVLPHCGVLDLLRYLGPILLLKFLEIVVFLRARANEVRTD